MKELVPFIKDDDLEKLNQAFLEIQMPRTPYTLEKLIVNTKFTEEQKYAQCVLELSIAYDNLRIAGAKAEIKQLEIDEMKGRDKKTQLEKKIAQVELEQTNRARIGAYREFEYLFGMWKSFKKNYTREELNEAQELEYKCRIELQALQDKNATGRISQGNQEALRQIGSTVYPELDDLRATEKRFLENKVSDVESKYLSQGNVKMMIAVATEKKAINGLPCLEGLEFPAGVQVKVFNSFDRPVDENYNNIVQEAINDKADYLVTVEDDTFPQPDAIVKLYELLKQNPMSAVGAWYPKKEESRQGVHIILKDGERTQLKADGGIHEVYTMAMGCSIYPVKMFTEIPYPWFKTTAILSQDSFFSQLAREKGYKLLVDTSVKCKHICRITGKIFE